MSQNAQLISQTKSVSATSSSKPRSLRQGEKINVGSLTRANVQVAQNSLIISLPNGQRISIPHFGRKCDQSFYLSDPKKANPNQEIHAVGLNISDKGLNLYHPDKTCGKIQDYDRMGTIELVKDKHESFYSFESKPSNGKFAYYTSLGGYGLGFSSAQQTKDMKDSFSNSK